MDDDDDQWEDVIDFEELNKKFTNKRRNSHELNLLRKAQRTTSPTQAMNENNKRPNESSENGRPKRAASTTRQTAGQSIPAADPSAKEATGVPAGSGDPINPGFTYIHKPRTSNSHIITFRNTIMVNTWAYAYANMKPNSANNNYAEITTPLAVIPVNNLTLYMSPAEYKKLPQFAKALSCRVRITPKGFRTSFATLDALPSYSNSNHTLFGVHAIGLNNDVFGRHCKITNSKKDTPMVPENCANVKKGNYEEIFWGLQDVKADDYYTEFPNIAMVKRSLPNYWAYHVYRPSTTPTNNQVATGYPMLREKITEWDFAGHVNKPIVHYSYKFTNGIIKSAAAFWPTPDADAITTHGFIGGQNIQNSRVEMTKDGKQVREERTDVKRTEQTIDDYTLAIDKGYLSGFKGTQMNLTPQPLVYIGMQPIEANMPRTVDNKQAYTNAQANWLIEAELTVEVIENIHFTRTPLLFPSSLTNMGDRLYKADDMLDSTNIDGTYSK